MASKWIKVEERMPDNNERVLLYTPYPVFGEDYTCVGNSESIAACTTRVGRKDVKIFTHWMPLPGKP